VAATILSRKIKVNCTLRNRRVLIIMAVVLLIFSAFQTLATNMKPCYYINLSRSVPLGLYRIIPPDDLKAGDLVILDPPQGVCSLIYNRRWLPAGWPLFKHVGALPGDTYCILDNSLFINDTHIGPVLDRDSEGMALSYMKGCRVVEPNTFLPVSTHIKTSFDGRYFGAVPLASVKGKALPVWVF
jgi:conjugative transfer signal peptidase TraF